MTPTARIGLALALVLAAPFDRSAAPAGEPPSIRLREVTASGVDFRHADGSRGRHDLPEIMGSGLALIDGDGDGRLDLFFCNGGPISGNGDDPPCRYYRNLGGFTFADATESAHAAGPCYATGAAVGDYDGDGRDDLLVTGWRGQRLYRNLGGRFEDATDRAGVGSTLWGTSAAFADLDGDGDLDLYVANYLDYDPDAAPYCAAPDGERDYCGPEDFPAQPDRLYRNNGDGTFADVSKSAGVDLPGGRGLGVVVADLVGDWRPDVFVANDGSACFLFENLGGLRFRDAAAAAGVAFDGQGVALAGMGAAVGDLDGDGRPDLAVGNFLGRSTVAFRSLGGGTYRDDSAAAGFAAATRGVLGFGLALADLDSDGDLDLIQANGHVLDRARLGVPAAMPPTVLTREAGRYVDASAGSTPWSRRAVLGRGLAVGDLDGDGRPDAVVTAVGGPPALLRNESAGSSLVVELVGRSPRTPYGARLRAEFGGRVVVRDVAGGGSYLSASDPRVFLAVGGAERIDRVSVTWPSGRVETWRDLPASGPLRLREGSGRAE